MTVDVREHVVTSTERGYFAILPLSSPRPESLVLRAPQGDTPTRLGESEEDHLYHAVWGLAAGHAKRVVTWTHQQWTETSSVVRLWELG